VLAQHYYTTACDADPAQGLALNQLALLCQSEQPFRAVQLFLAAKLSPRPFARAGDNLRAVLKMKESSSLRPIESIILRISQLFLLNFRFISMSSQCLLLASLNESCLSACEDRIWLSKNCAMLSRGVCSTRNASPICRLRCPLCP
jgi:hypothetical protein